MAVTRPKMNPRSASPAGRVSSAAAGRGAAGAGWALRASLNSFSRAIAGAMCCLMTRDPSTPAVASTKTPRTTAAAAIKSFFMTTCLTRRGGGALHLPSEFFYRPAEPADHGEHAVDLEAAAALGPAERARADAGLG